MRGEKTYKFKAMDVLDMPFEENSFDIIVANSMLYHVNDVECGAGKYSSYFARRWCILCDDFWGRRDGKLRQPGYV